MGKTEGGIGSPPKENQRERILLGAIRVLLRDGLMALTLDAVAKEASVSKGGLLYHFASKDALLRGMIAHFQDQQESQMRRIAEGDPEPLGRWVRAFIDVSTNEARQGEAIALSRSETLALKMTLLSAIALNPELLHDVRQRCDKWLSQLIDSASDPVESWISCLATDGLWLWELFGLFPADESMRRAIIERLRERTYSRGDKE